MERFKITLKHFFIVSTRTQVKIFVSVPCAQWLKDQGSISKAFCRKLPQANTFEFVCKIFIPKFFPRPWCPRFLSNEKFFTGDKCTLLKMNVDSQSTSYVVISFSNIGLVAPFIPAPIPYGVLDAFWGYFHRSLFGDYNCWLISE